MQSGMNNVVEVPNEIDNMFQEIAKASSKKPEKQEKYLNFLYDLYANLYPSIQHLNGNADAIVDMLNTWTKNLITITKQIPKKAAVVTTMGVFGIMGAAARDISINAGQAPGGANLCDGMINCMQGYLSENGKVLAAFNTFVEVLNNCGKNCNNGGIGLIWAFNEALKQPAIIGGIIRDIYQQNSTLDIVSACTATINKFGSNIGSQVQKLTVEQCSAYKTAFEAEIQKTLTEGKVIGYNWAIAGIVLASVLVCVCCGVGAFCTYAKCKK